MSYIDTLFNTIKNEHGVRFNKKQKANFREFAIKEFKGTTLKVFENKKNKPKSLISSTTTEIKCVITAHYDTPGRSLLILPFLKILNRYSPFCKWDSKGGDIKNIIESIPFILIFIMAFTASILTDNDIFIYGFALLCLVDVISTFSIANPNNYNDNTSGILALFSIAEKVKNKNNLDKTLFIFCDKEERGLKGSKYIFKKRQKDFRNKPVINLDCIGNGDTLIISYLNNSTLESCTINTLIDNLKRRYEERHIDTEIFYKYQSSDYKSFKNSFAISIGLCSKSKYSYSLGHVHTSKDNKINLVHIEIISEEIAKLIDNGTLIDTYKEQ